MGTIGNLAVGLSLNPTDYLTGLDRAGRKMEAFGRDVGKFATLPANALKGISALPTRAVDGFLGPIKSLLTSLPVIGGMFAAIPGSAGEFTSWIRSTIGEMAEMVKTSQKVGVSVGTMSALMVGSGMGPEDLTKNLNHLSRELAAVQMGDKEPTAKFGRLGFDPQELAGQGMDGALKTIADRMAGLSSGTDKAKLAFDLFGKSGADMIPLLSRGSAGIDAAAEKAKQLGISFSDVDGKQILEANRSFGMIGMTIKGIGTQIAVNLAPYIAAAGKSFMGWATSGQSAGDIVTGVIEGIVTGIGYLGDGYNTVVGVFKAGSAAIAGLLADVLETIADSLDALAKVPVAGKAVAGMGDDVRLWANASKEAARELAGEADKKFHAPSMVAETHKFFDGIKAAAKATAAATKSSADDAKKLADTARQFDLLQKGQELTKELETPLEKFVDRYKELNDVLGAVGKTFSDSFKRGVDKALEDYNRLQGKELIKGPEALTAGSAASISAINRANRVDGAGDTQKQIKELLKQGKELQQKHLEATLGTNFILGDLGLANLDSTA